MDKQRDTWPTVLGFASLGLLGGLIAFLLFDFEPTPVLLTTPILCGLVGAVVARARFGWLAMLALVPFAGAINGAVSAMFVLGSRHLADGAIVGAFASVPFYPACLLVGLITRRFARARPGSLVAGIDRRRLVLAFAVMAGMGGVLLALVDKPVRHTGIAVIVGAMLLLIDHAARSVLVWLRVQELTRLAAFLRPTQSADLETRGEDYVDLGVGRTRYVYLEPATLMRGTPVARLLIEGDPSQALTIARNATLLAGITFFFALGGILSCVVGR
jgi:hypothetical protein